MTRAMALALFLLLAGCGHGAKTAPPSSDAAPPSPPSAPLVVDAAPPLAIADAAPPPPTGPLNVLLITIDSLRADMPWAGYPRPIAPRLSALKEKSVYYPRAYSTSSFTSKSIPGLLTGKVPSELSRTGSFFTKYLDPKDFLCTSLAAQDIACLGGHAHAYFGKGQSGFESGFRDWQLVKGIAFDYQTDPYITSDKLTALAKTMLASPPPRFFAWFHYMDPHDEYHPHQESPHFGKKPRDLYDEEVFWTDSWIGQLLDFVSSQPWAEKTAIIVTADHGEMFGEHGMTRHAHEIWEELVRVPLFVYLPGNAPRTIDVARGAGDLVPTFADLLGATPPSGLRGTSLVPEVRGATVPARDIVVDLPEDEYNERRRALVHDHLKLIAFGKDQRFALYDLAADPKETTDLSKKQPESFAEMRARYKDMSDRIVESPPKGGIPKHDVK